MANNVILDETFMVANCEWNFYKARLKEKESSLVKGIDKKTKDKLKEEIEKLRDSIKILEDRYKQKGFSKPFFVYYDDPIEFDIKNANNLGASTLHAEVLKKYEGFFCDDEVFKVYLEMKVQLIKGYSKGKFIYEDNSKKIEVIRDEGLKKLRNVVNKCFIDKRLGELRKIAEKYPEDLMQTKNGNELSNFEELEKELEKCKTPDELDVLFQKTSKEYNNLDFKRDLLVKLGSEIKYLDDKETLRIINGFINNYKLYNLDNKEEVEAILRKTIYDVRNRNAEISKTLPERKKHDEVIERIFKEWDKAFGGNGDFIDGVIEETKEVLNNHKDPERLRLQCEMIINVAIQWKDKLYKFLEQCKKNKMLSLDISKIEARINQMLPLYLSSEKEKKEQFDILKKEVEDKVIEYKNTSPDLKMKLINELNAFFGDIQLRSSVNYKEQINDLDVLRISDYETCKKDFIDRTMLSNIALAKKELEKKRAKDSDSLTLINEEDEDSKMYSEISRWLSNFERVYINFSKSVFHKVDTNKDFRLNYVGLMAFIQGIIRELSNDSILSEFAEYEAAFKFVKQLMEEFEKKVNGPDVIQFGTRGGRK